MHDLHYRSDRFRKKTTLYMALQKLSNRKVNIATIEDPVEEYSASISAR